jgi:hypothetical protein
MASANERMAPHLTSILKVRLPRAARDATSSKVSLYRILSRDTVGHTKSEETDIAICGIVKLLCVH